MRWMFVLPLVCLALAALLCGEYACSCLDPSEVSWDGETVPSHVVDPSTCDVDVARLHAKL
jgi:hypothetical protein